MTIVREFAPAKVNLTLEVLGRRADGYHELNSLVAFASVGDHVTLDTSKPVGTSVTGPFGMTIAGANLIDVTLAKLAAAEPRLQLGHVTLEKQLPIAAGIGGGSADAAAVLRAVRRVNPALVDAVDWTAIAVSLGADVPVCLASRLSWMRGLGERVLPLEAAEAINLPALIVNPLAPVPADKTAQVFRALAAAPVGSERPAAATDRARWDEATLRSFVRESRNDLQEAAGRVVPLIGGVLAALAASPGCDLARMSGGGPTCFALFQSEKDAESAARQIALRHSGWWVQITTLN